MMGAIILVLYWAVAYWAANETVYKNKVFIEFKPGSVFIQKSITALFAGFILIPIALIKKLLFK